MTHDNVISRRTALTTLTGAALTAIAGCLDTIPPGSSSGSTAPDEGGGTLSTEMADGRLIVTLTDNAEVDRLNLVQPNGELYSKKEVAAGVFQVTFELGTTYQPGDYTILALDGDTTTAETTQTIQPDLAITNVGLYRNHPDKPWDEVYDESETDRTRNSEAFVTVKNAGSGPDTVVELAFTGDVPNPLPNPDGSGIYDAEQATIPAEETIDIFSDSYPFSAKTGDGMGCSPDGKSGKFTITLTTSVNSDELSKTFAVHYEGSDEMTDCSIEISET